MTRRGLVLALAAAAAILPVAAAAGAAPKLPPIRHVFVLVLENESFDDSFGPSSPAPYLAKTLTRRGEFLTHYYATGHASLDNYIAMVSGQAPNLQTQLDCPRSSNVTPGVMVDGQATGSGCVYPPAAETIADQLAAKHLTWRGYMETMPKPCDHPAAGGSAAPETATMRYAPRHDPFVWFHSIIDNARGCARHVVALPALRQDLRKTKTTANYSFITPDVCHDGHDAPCKNGEPGGLKSADRFLRTWVPGITSSPAFKRDGLLIITFDEAGLSDADSCCGELPGPGSPLPGLRGSGGGRTGAVLLSRYVRPGSVVSTPYNHYAQLRSVQDLFRLPHVGYAAQSGLRAFGTDVYNRRVKR